MIHMTPPWDKQKIWVAHGSRQHQAGAPSTELRKLMESKAI